MKKSVFLYSLAILAAGCTDSEGTYDAVGNFEATEIIVSAEATGRILSFPAREGTEIKPGETVVSIDSTQLFLRKLALEKDVQSVVSTAPDIQKQIAATQEQLQKQEQERRRTESLMQDHAATQKQLDDILSAIAVLRKQLDAQKSTLSNSTTSIREKSSAMEIQVAQLSDQLSKCKVSAPAAGTILAKYAEAGELAVPGKPLFKMADLTNMYLRAYVTSSQLADLRIGQKVKVYADFGDGHTREYPGVVQWISDKSEFTPKSVTTSDERASTVYAVKVAFRNDGHAKIGLYGGIRL